MIIILAELGVLGLVGGTLALHSVGAALLTAEVIVLAVTVPRLVMHVREAFGQPEDVSTSVRRREQSGSSP